MISAVTGELREVFDDRVNLRVGAMLFELLVPAVDVEELRSRIGEEITFHTWFYLQGESTGGMIQPRLIGFLRMDDRLFFEKFITVKSIGPKTALRALTVPIAEIAGAIETKDARFLVGLDGIGKRTAELIIAELSGKVERFATGPLREVIRPTRLSTEDELAIAAMTSPTMGLRRADAEALLHRTKKSNPELESADELIPEMLRQHASRA